MANERVGGIISFKTDGKSYSAKGAFTYDVGEPIREAVVGHDSVHGYSEKPKVPFIEGEITDSASLDTQVLANLTNVTATLDLANGKVIMLRNAWYSGAMEGNTEEGMLPVRFEADRGEEIPA